VQHIAALRRGAVLEVVLAVLMSAAFVVRSICCTGSAHEAAYTVHVPYLRKYRCGLARSPPNTQDEVGSMGSKVSVVKLPKSGGVAQRQSAARQDARSERISAYFHGPDKTLHPVTHTIEPEKLRVFRLGELTVNSGGAFTQHYVQCGE
jgi:hypothetical protein